MKIRRYQKAHLCKHIDRTGNVLVFVKPTCPMGQNWPSVDYVFKAHCRACEHFELKEVEKE
jgi:hypothetical protein